MLEELLDEQKVYVASIKGITPRWVTAHWFEQLLREKAAEEREEAGIAKGVEEYDEEDAADAEEEEAGEENEAETACMHGSLDGTS